MPDLTLAEAGSLAPLVSPSQAAALVESGAVLIDVRSDAGRLSAGALPGATVVAKDDVQSRFDLASPGAVASSKSTPVVVVCGSVRGSGPVAAQLIADGFTDVVHVEGGFPAWEQAGLPTGLPAVEASPSGRD